MVGGNPWIIDNFLNQDIVNSASKVRNDPINESMTQYQYLWYRFTFTSLTEMKECTGWNRLKQNKDCTPAVSDTDSGSDWWRCINVDRQNIQVNQWQWIAVKKTNLRIVYISAKCYVNFLAQNTILSFSFSRWNTSLSFVVSNVNQFNFYGCESHGL